MIFRTLQKNDVLEVRKLALKAWKFAYKDIYKEKTILKSVSKYYSDENFARNFEQIKKGNSKFILVIESKKIIGYAHVCKNKRRWEVIRIYVNPKFIRKGIGTKLLQKVEVFLRKKNVKSYTIYPHVKNKIAVNFYKKYGFVRYPKLDEGWNSPCYVKKV